MKRYVTSVGAVLRTLWMGLPSLALVIAVTAMGMRLQRDRMRDLERFNSLQDREAMAVNLEVRGLEAQHLTAAERAELIPLSQRFGQVQETPEMWVYHQRPTSNETPMEFLRRSTRATREPVAAAQPIKSKTPVACKTVRAGRTAQASGANRNVHAGACETSAPVRTVEQRQAAVGEADAGDAH